MSDIPEQDQNNDDNFLDLMGSVEWDDSKVEGNQSAQENTTDAIHYYFNNNNPLLVVKDSASRFLAEQGTSSKTTMEQFEPQFLVIYNAFKAHIESEGDTLIISFHLLGTCLKNLIRFCCWARSSADMMRWLHQILFQSPDLRPELRNGLVMILIYTFAAGKSAEYHHQPVNIPKVKDMFTILQDSERGLGITHKTALRIYNDPFLYYTFLKGCLTGLIDCGVIPENERNNRDKVRRTRKHLENLGKP